MHGRACVEAARLEKPEGLDAHGPRQDGGRDSFPRPEIVRADWTLAGRNSVRY